MEKKSLPGIITGSIKGVWRNATAFIYPVRQVVQKATLIFSLQARLVASAFLFIFNHFLNSKKKICAAAVVQFSAVYSLMYGTNRMNATGAKNCKNQEFLHVCLFSV